MPNWKHTLNLKDAWDQKKSDEIDTKQLAGIVAKRLRKIDFKDEYFNMRRDEYSDYMEDIERSDETDEDSLTEDFDNVLSDIYDLGDTLVERKQFHNDVKLMWIKTSF